MKLAIHKLTSTREIKDAFHSAFPFLKVEFFKKVHAPGEATSVVNLVKDDLPLGQLNNDLKNGSIELKPDDSVSLVEQTFQQQFGLPVQVFRKQKDVWIETTKTDRLTLSQQNEKGKEASAPITRSAPADRYLDDGQY